MEASLHGCRVAWPRVSRVTQTLCRSPCAAARSERCPEASHSKYNFRAAGSHSHRWHTQNAYIDAYGVVHQAWGADKYTDHSRDTIVSNELEPIPESPQAIVYQIRLKGRLDLQWSKWFEGLTITLEGSDETLLTGPVIDQAALHGLLKKVRDLGMPLVSLSQIQCNETRPKC